MSHSWTSTRGAPSTSHSAIAFATPAEWVTQTASASQKPRTSRDSPISGMPSVVNEKTPLIPSSHVAPRRAGITSWAQPHDWAKSSGVNSSTEGITGASAGERSVAGSIGIGRWPYAPIPRRSTCSRAYRSRSWMRRIGRRSSMSAGAAMAASSGSGEVLTYWWASGWSGTGTPASAPTRGPQMPAAQTTMSAGNSPRSVTTAVTRPPSVRTSVTVCSPRNRTPASVARRAWASPARTALARPSVGTR